MTTGVDDALVMLGVTAVAAEGTMHIVEQVEKTSFGVAPSLMLAAVAGSIAGVFVYQIRRGLKPPLPTSTEHGWRLVFDVFWRIGLFGDEVDGIREFDPLAGARSADLPDSDVTLTAFSGSSHRFIANKRWERATGGDIIPALPRGAACLRHPMASRAQARQDFRTTAPVLM